MTSPRSEYTPEKVTDAREALDQLHRYSFGDNSEIDRTYVSVLVERISDALAAVSAERDELRVVVHELRAGLDRFSAVAFRAEATELLSRIPEHEDTKEGTE